MFHRRRFKQRDVTDCGACCLAFIAAHHRKIIPIARVRQIAGTDQVGSTALGLIEAAVQLGFSAKGVKGPINALPSVPLPAIAHCMIDGKHPHYVVLQRWNVRCAEVLDPASGRTERWSHARFQSVWTGVLVLVAPTASLEASDESTSDWARLWGLLRPHRGLLLQVLIGAIATTFLGLAMSIYVEKIIDHVVPEDDRALLNVLALGMLAVLALKLALGWFQSILSLQAAQRIDATLLLSYYRHLFRLPQSFFDTMRVGEITSRVADAVKIRHFLNNTLLSLALNPLILVLSLGLMFLHSSKLALLSLALLPANAAVYWIVDRRNQRLQRRLMESTADFNAHLTESLATQSVIRRFQLEEHAASRAEHRLMRLLRGAWNTSRLALGGSTATAALTQTYLIGLLWIGAGLVLATDLTPGQLMSCYTLAGYLTSPMTAIIGLNGSIREALVATDRLFEIMDLERECDDGTIACTPRHCGDIQFDHVSFKHPGRRPLLRGISFTLQAGKITALVGPSGCGKSTVLALLQRLHTPTQGRITLGGHDLRYFTLRSLRQQIASVPQHPQLFSGTVMENLAPGHERPDMERVISLCRSVGVLGFIEQLPAGFLTPVGENGANLSGGQRQRLTLVRALYRDAALLLLDEPSASLDADAEQQMTNLLLSLRATGRTIVIATHCSPITAIADQIITVSGANTGTQAIATDRPAASTA